MRRWGFGGGAGVHSKPLFTKFNTLLITDTEKNRQREKERKKEVGVEEREEGVCE